MEEFVLGIDRDKFSSTNGKWNSLMLNDPWSVGYVSTLIELQSWQSKEEWEEFYYRSGEQRQALLGDNRDLLDNFSLIRTNREAVNKHPWDVKNLNTQYGRTREDLKRKAEELFIKYTLPPYGMSEDIIVLLISVICANLSYCLRIQINKELQSISNWKDKVVIKDKKASKTNL